MNVGRDHCMNQKDCDRQKVSTSFARGYKQIFDMLMIEYSTFASFSVERCTYIVDIGWKLRCALYLISKYLDPSALASGSLYFFLETSNNRIDINKNLVINPNGKYLLYKGNILRYVIEFQTIGEGNGKDSIIVKVFRSYIIILKDKINDELRSIHRRST